jgi:hypothetical protein
MSNHKGQRDNTRSAIAEIASINADPTKRGIARLAHLLKSRNSEIAVAVAMLDLAYGDPPAEVTVRLRVSRKAAAAGP